MRGPCTMVSLILVSMVCAAAKKNRVIILARMECVVVEDAGS